MVLHLPHPAARAARPGLAHSWHRAADGRPAAARPRAADLRAAGRDPDRRRAAPRARAAPAWTGWWGLGGTVVVAAGFGAWQLRLNSPQIIVLRQPGAMFQLGYWIAGHGSLPIPASLHDFGGAHPGLGFASTGLAATHGGLAPQFPPGLAVVVAGGWGIHGIATPLKVKPMRGDPWGAWRGGWRGPRGPPRRPWSSTSPCRSST